MIFWDLLFFLLTPQDANCEQWTDGYTDEGSNDDSDSDEILCEIQVNYIFVFLNVPK